MKKIIRCVFDIKILGIFLIIYSCTTKTSVIATAPIPKDLSLAFQKNTTFVHKLEYTFEKNITPRFEIITDVSKGTLSIDETAQSFSYVPNNNFVGKDFFIYKIHLGTTHSRTATIELDVGGVNNAPVISGTPLSILVTEDVVYSGGFSASDAEADTISFVLVSSPSHGNINLSNDGTYTYTPDGSYVGTDSFSIKVSDGNLDSSTAVVTVNVQEACPSNYIRIGANATLGTATFCVMKFEARNDGSGNPVSTSSGNPWTSIDRPTAKTECTDLGADYDLISNREWMSIAYLAEMRPENWSGDEVANGNMIQGHSDLNPNNVLGVGDVSDDYDGTGDDESGNWEQRRTLVLSDSDKIWDLAGNVLEWVDWSTGGVLSKGFLCASSGFYEFRDIATFCPSANILDYLPLDPEGIGANYDATYGLGIIYGTDNAAQGVPLRGGYYQSNSGATFYSGVYSLLLDVVEADSAPAIGFRCVKR